MDKITDPAMMAVVLAYCRAQRVSCWTVYTAPERAHLPYAGTSCELLAIDGADARVRIANGDELVRPVAHLHLCAE